MNDLGDRLEELRISKKMTMEEMGKAVGASKMAVSRWEKGQRQPKPEYIKAYADFFGVSEDWIRYGSYKKYVMDTMLEAIYGDNDSCEAKKFVETLRIIRYNEILPSDRVSDLKILEKCLSSYEKDLLKLKIGYNKEKILHSLSFLMLESSNDDYEKDIARVKQYATDMFFIVKEMNFGRIPTKILFNDSKADKLDEKYKKLREIVNEYRDEIINTCDELSDTICSMLKNVE